MGPSGPHRLPRAPRQRQSGRGPGSGFGRGLTAWCLRAGLPEIPHSSGPRAEAERRSLFRTDRAANVYSANSYIAEVAEVSLARDLTDLRVHRIVCAADCGLVLNPLGIVGQAESGITWGLSYTLHGAV